MGERMECPGCESYTSSVLHAVRDGEPCPYCGLSAAAIKAVEEVRESRGNEALMDQIRVLLIDMDRLEVRAIAAEAKLSKIERLLESNEGEL